MLINRFIFCTTKIQITIVVFSCVVNIPFTPTIHIHILPFGWLNREFRGMSYNYLLSNMVLLLSIASTTSSNVPYVHFPLLLIANIL
jgi:hypothetical protein